MLSMLLASLLLLTSLGIPAVAGLHAIAGILADASPADHAWFQWFVSLWPLLSDYRIVKNRISDQDLNMLDYRRSDSQKTTGLPSSAGQYL
jgi:hypothetical protein